MSQFDRVPVAGTRPGVELGPVPSLAPRSGSPETSADDPSGWRSQAHAEVDTELAAALVGVPVVAVRSDGFGELVVGIAGPVDRAMAHRVGAQLRGLRPHSTGRLLLTLTRLGRWDGHLVRLLGRVRFQHLIEGGHLELHDAPAGLLADLHRAPALPAPRGDHTGEGPSDHDRAAAARLRRGLIADIDRVGVVAAAHRGDPQWCEVAVVLEHVRATLSHDLLQHGPTLEPGL